MLEIMIVMEKKDIYTLEYTLKNDNKFCSHSLGCVGHYSEMIIRSIFKAIFLFFNKVIYLIDEERLDLVE